MLFFMAPARYTNECCGSGEGGSRSCSCSCPGVSQVLISCHNLLTFVIFPFFLLSLSLPFPLCDHSQLRRQTAAKKVSRRRERERRGSTANTLPFLRHVRSGQRSVCLILILFNKLLLQCQLLLLLLSLSLLLLSLSCATSLPLLFRQACRIRFHLIAQ